jgi:hypothetical protein
MPTLEALDFAEVELDQRKLVLRNSARLEYVHSASTTRGRMVTVRAATTDTTDDSVLWGEKGGVVVVEVCRARSHAMANRDRCS